MITSICESTWGKPTIASLSLPLNWPKNNSFLLIKTDGKNVKSRCSVNTLPADT